ncbi:MAG: TetR/AcrR family transcriptional regulator [Bacteroidota bacterium]|nr:TetR/AcrR family transcriptional regulator [Bacteroidota bacterium]
MSHLDRKIREKEAVKNSIFCAARKIASKEGWSAVTIRKIADAIEYTPPIVYEYFDSKEDLFKELVYLGFKIIRDSIENIKKQATAPKEFLSLLALGQWDFASNNPDLYQLMFSIERPVPNQEMTETFLAIKGAFLELANNDEELTLELMINWACMVNGSISFIMQNPPPNRKKIPWAPRDLYFKIINRFLNSI